MDKQMAGTQCFKKSMSSSYIYKLCILIKNVHLFCAHLIIFYYTFGNVGLRH